MPQGSPWQVDRHIPVAMLGGMVVQLFAIVWWASFINTSVSDLKTTNTDMKVAVVNLTSSVIDLKIDVARLQSRLGRTVLQKGSYE